MFKNKSAAEKEATVNRVVFCTQVALIVGGLALAVGAAWQKAKG